MKLPILFFLLLPAIAGAKERTYRVLFLNGPDSAPNAMHLFDGKSSQTVELPRLNFSRIYKIRPGELTLRLSPSPISDPKKIPRHLPKVHVSEEVGDFYLLITSYPAHKSVPLRMRIIDAGKKKYKRGEMLWFNMTNHSVKGTVGSKKLHVEPRSSLVLGSPAKGNQDYPVNLDYYTRTRNHRHSLCETSWRHDPRSRSVAIIYADIKRRSLRILVFPDYRESKK